jgi:peptide/nickel transport system permease protein
MLKLIGRRLLAIVPVLFGVMLLTLLLVELIPGDPAIQVAGPEATPEAVAAVRSELRLDQPVWERYGKYTWNALQGDLGRSPVSHVAVSSRIWAALPVTFSLAVVGLAFAVILGVAAGALGAIRRGRPVDRALTVLTSAIQAVPPFMVGLALVIPLAVDRSWFPGSGYVPLREGVWEWFHHLVLPGATLAMAPAAQLARQTRGSLVDVLEADYIRTMRAKGLRERAVIGKHAAKNAATPVATVFGLQAGAVLGGAVIVELIFGMPGFGALALNAVLARDITLIQGVVLVSAVGALLTNLIVDVSYGYFNPRLRE